MGHWKDERDGEVGTEHTDAIERLTEEIHTLRMAVDELREALVWELRQLREAAPQWPARLQLTSMPADPTAPDFHRRVNAVDASVFAAPATFEELVQRLTSQAATAQLSAEGWVEDQEFPPGDVVGIDAAIRDWFGEYLVAVKDGPEWFLADDGEGWFYLLWSRNEQHFVLLLTDEQAQEVTRLTGLAPDQEYAEAGGPTHEPPPDSAFPPSPAQRSLWTD
jgi:hypothetical protein